MRFTFPLIAAIVSSFLGLFYQKPFYADVKAQDSKAAIHILRSNDEGEVVFEDIRPALFAARLENGSVSPGIYECKQQTEEREIEGVHYPVVVIICGDAKMVISGIDLSEK